MHGFQLFRVQLVQPMPALPRHADNSDLEEDAQVLGHRRLRFSHRAHNVADGVLLAPH